MKMLNRNKSPIMINGAVIYYDKSRSKCIIRIKKRLLEEFPDIIHENNVYYQAELWRTHEELINRIKRIQENKQGVPILLFLYK